MITSVTKLFEFEAAHHLPNYDGACKNLHGHTYKMEVEVARLGGRDKDSGMIIDFKNLKATVNELIINRFDHSNLNDFFELPTAEVMVEWVFDELKRYYDAHKKGVIMKRVRLWETSTSYAETIRG